MTGGVDKKEWTRRTSPTSADALSAPRAASPRDRARGAARRVPRVGEVFARALARARARSPLRDARRRPSRRAPPATRRSPTLGALRGPREPRVFRRRRADDLARAEIAAVAELLRNASAYPRRGRRASAASRGVGARAENRQVNSLRPELCACRGAQLVVVVGRGVHLGGGRPTSARRARLARTWKPYGRRRGRSWRSPPCARGAARARRLLRRAARRRSRRREARLRRRGRRRGARGARDGTRASEAAAAARVAARRTSRD